MKKELNKQQLIEDGFVQLKSLRECIAEGLLQKGDVQKSRKYLISFRNIRMEKCYIQPGMIECLGKIVNTGYYFRNSFFYCPDCGWHFPIEVIKR
jgi:hypothetical protein